MNATTLPLIARLRLRLTGVAWLFVFLVCSKSAFAIACETEAAPNDASVSMLAAAPADAVPDASAFDDSGAGACWHLAADGCHCSCAHCSALAPSPIVIASVSLVARQQVAHAAAPAPAPPGTTLRPPIVH